MMDTHQLGFCHRFAVSETCIGCGDPENGIPLEKTVKELDVESMRACLIKFARIWAINEPLNPPIQDGIRNWTAGVWPTMEDAKEAYDLVWSTRKETE